MGRQKKEKKQFNKKHLGIKITAILVLIVLLGVVSFNIYASDYYMTTMEGQEYFVSDTNVDVFTKGDKICFIPKKPSDTGIIFYPGAKIESSAYAPLMKLLAERGIYCVICDMPYHLALFDKDAAEDVIGQEEFANVNHWYLAGHSLGGAMAASYLSDNASKYDGIVLLASYSTANLKNMGLKVLTIYGDHDKILNMDKLEKNAKNLPDDAVTDVIDNGTHSGFGCYGIQKGDFADGITSISQIEKTVQMIVDFIVDNQK